MSNYIVRNENGKYTVEENEKVPANSVLEHRPAPNQNQEY